MADSATHHQGSTHSLPGSGVIARELANDLEAALRQFSKTVARLSPKPD